MIDIDEDTDWDDDGYPPDPDDYWQDSDPRDHYDDYDVPGCLACGDTGRLPAGPLRQRLTGNDERRCRACTAGWLWRLRWRIAGRLIERWRYSRLAAWWHRVDAQRRGIDLSDEPPF